MATIPHEPRPSRTAAAPPPTFEDEAPAAAPVVEFINALLRGRYIIIGVTALVVALTVGFVLTQTRRYTATFSFISQSTKMPSNLSGLASQFGIALPTADGGMSPQFYADLVSSRDLLTTIGGTSYATTTDTGRATGTLFDIWGTPGLSTAARQDQVIRRLRAAVQAGANPKTGLVSVGVTDKNPDLAFQISAQLLQALNDFNLRTRQTQAARERRFTEGQASAALAELRRAEDALRDFLMQNRSYRDAPALLFQYERLSREVGFRQTLYTALSQSLEQAKIEEVRDTPVITPVDRPLLPVRPISRMVVVKGLLSILLGLLLGVAIALIRDSTRPPVRDAADPFTELGLLRREVLQELRHPIRTIRRSS